MRHGVLLVTLLACACGSSNSNNGGDGGGGGGGDMAIPFSGDMTGSTVQSLTIGPINLAAGEERTVCSRFRLPSTSDLDVVQIDATLAPGSHHLILYKSDETTEQKDIYDCPPLDTNNEVPLYIAETKTNNHLPLPTGVAYHLVAGQMVKLEAHYLNASSNAIVGQGDVQLTIGAPATYQPADIMFCGSVVQLYTTGVPPGMSSLNPGFYQIPAGIKIFGLTTHQHMRGSLMTIDKSTSSAAGTNLVMGKPYDNPPFVVYDDAHVLSFAAGEGLRWQCFYDNPDQMTYMFGQSAQSNEMCFLWAYYYPSAGRFISQQDCWR
jgi:Copper type II ascorbate-dependent monooxygenase, C-terminal domain